MKKKFLASVFLLTMILSLVIGNMSIVGAEEETPSGKVVFNYYATCTDEDGDGNPELSNPINSVGGGEYFYVEVVFKDFAMLKTFHMALKYNPQIVKLADFDTGAVVDYARAKYDTETMPVDGYDGDYGFITGNADDYVGVDLFDWDTFGDNMFVMLTNEQYPILNTDTGLLSICTYSGSTYNAVGTAVSEATAMVLKFKAMDNVMGTPQFTLDTTDPIIPEGYASTTDFTEKIDVSFDFGSLSISSELPESILFSTSKSDNLLSRAVNTGLFSSTDDIKKIAFVNMTNIDLSNKTTVDYSRSNGESVLAWADSETGTLYIGGYGKIIASESLAYAFYNGYFIEGIDGLEMLDTSNATDMNSMFFGCGQNSAGFSLNVSNFDTSNVTDMNNMFFACGQNSTNLTLDLSSWDTSDVTNMSYMFSCCGQNNTNFTLNVSNFNTSNVTNMRSMFDSCGQHSTVWYKLDLSSFDVSKVTEFSYFAYAIPQITALKFSVGWENAALNGIKMFYVNSETETTVIDAPENIKAYDWASDNRTATFITSTAPKWVTDTDGGYFDRNGEKIGLIRFLFDVVFDSDISAEEIVSGVKYIKADNITEDIGNATFAGESDRGTATTFYSDLTEITEDKKDVTYYAVGFITVGEKTYWSSPIGMTPNFERALQ